MGGVGDVADAKPGFPVAAVHEGAAKSGVIGVFSGPGLNGHVVNVNPPAHGGLPRHFVFPNLDDGVAQSGGGNAGEVSSC